MFLPLRRRSWSCWTVFSNDSSTRSTVASTPPPADLPSCRSAQFTMNVDGGSSDGLGTARFGCFQLPTRLRNASISSSGNTREVLRRNLARYEYSHATSLSPFSKRLEVCHLDIRTVSSTTSNTAGSKPNPTRIAVQSDVIGVGRTPVEISPPSGVTSAHARWFSGGWDCSSNSSFSDMSEFPSTVLVD